MLLSLGAISWSEADFCKRGVERTISFCAQHDIPVENCGKLLVATNEQEDLYE